MTPETEPTHEPPGEEFGVACFEELESAKVHEAFIEQIGNEIKVPKEIMQKSKECKNYTCWLLGVCQKRGIWGWWGAPCMSNKK